MVHKPSRHLYLHGGKLPINWPLGSCFINVCLHSIHELGTKYYYMFYMYMIVFHI